MSVPHRVKGWCPGALRPMATGDGLLVRLRIAGGIVPAALARAIADLADRHGNGLVDQSQRANLQLRGVTPESWPALIAALGALGLLDADPAAEAIRNVVASPLAGLDPAASVDGAALAAALDAALGAAADLRALPGKFGFAVDQGGALGLDDTAVDIRLAGQPDGRILLSLGGGAAEAQPAAWVEPGEAAGAAIALARAYLALRRPDERRMRALVARIGAAAIARAAGLEPVAPETVPARARAAPALGFHPLAGSADGFLLVAPPFGRWEAAQLRAAAAVAERFGAGALRLTPWRCVVVPGVAAGRVAAALGEAEAAGLIVAPDDARLTVVACAGAPACDSARQPARDDAARLAAAAARLSGSGIRLHVSGCPKGCARPGPAPVTLVGTAVGYDLVLDGRTVDPPVESGLTLDMALARLAALAENTSP